MVYVCEEVADETIPEDSMLRARVVEMKERSFQWTDYKVNPPEQRETTKLRWYFEITDGEYRTKRVHGETDPNLSTHPRNRFRQWAEALLNREVPGGMKVDTDDLVGLPCMVTIAHRKDKKDPSRVWVEVDGVAGLSSATGWGGNVPF